MATLMNCLFPFTNDFVFFFTPMCFFFASQNQSVYPLLFHSATPTKEMDEMGVATPELVISYADESNLLVEGEGFMGQYSPLTKANLDDKLTMELVTFFFFIINRNFKTLINR